ncbi:hypothetical protein SELMODRAFT_126062, partial [Selaginella moellendorffii]
VYRKGLEKPKTWSKHFPKALWTFCMTNESTTSYTPFQLCYTIDTMHPIQLKLSTLHL